MTATTPPMTAWYVLEVDGTGLASNRGGEKAERREGMLWFILGPTQCSAVEVEDGKERSQGEAGGKAVVMWRALGWAKLCPL